MKFKFHLVVTIEGEEKPTVIIESCEGDWQDGLDSLFDLTQRAENLIDEKRLEEARNEE